MELQYNHRRNFKWQLNSTCISFIRQITKVTTVMTKRLHQNFCLAHSNQDMQSTLRMQSQNMWRKTVFESIDMIGGRKLSLSCSFCSSKLFYVKAHLITGNQLFLIDCYFKATHLVNVKKIYYIKNTNVITIYPFKGLFFSFSWKCLSQV